MTRLFLLFSLVPAVELYLLVTVGSIVGPGPMVALVLITGFVGATLARREGLAVLQQLQADVARGLPPAQRLVEAALVLAGGLLLLTPGMITDVIGLSLLIPPIRAAVAPRLIEAAAAWGSRHATTVRFSHMGAHGERVVHETPPRVRPSSSPFDHPIA